MIGSFMIMISHNKETSNIFQLGFHGFLLFHFLPKLIQEVLGIEREHGLLVAAAMDTDQSHRLATCLENVRGQLASIS